MVGVGEVVGELGFAADVPRTADVVAVEETRVLVMDRTSLARVARYLPTISAKLFANLMDLMGRRFASAMERSGPGQGPPRPEAPPP
jgi:NTE family protein